MSDLTVWISVDRTDGWTKLSTAKPQDDFEDGQFWRTPFTNMWLGRIGESETKCGVGRGQCRQFKLFPVGELIDGKTEAES